MINSIHTLVFFLFLAFIQPSETTNDCVQGNDTVRKINSNQKKIFINIQVNKIYSINEQDETYAIDGYLVASWKLSDSSKYIGKSVIFENESVDEKIKNEIWVPAFEFINVVSSRSVGNKQLFIRKNGSITYNERFNAVFTSPMYFQTFPFDTQKYAIQLETFSYSEDRIVFEQAKNQQSFDEKGIPGEWIFVDEVKSVNSKSYTHLSEHGETVFYSRYNQEILAKRKTRYYIWQFIIPLILFIMMSWSVFWLSSFSDQLSTSFTLLLTVVAFNFNMSSILPNLPYHTFMESLITIGYLSISIGLLFIIRANVLKRRSPDFNHENFLKWCKLLFPISFLVMVTIQLLIFFVFGMNSNS